MTNLFFQGIGAVLTAVVLITVLRRQGQDAALLLGIAVCCMILFLAAGFLEPILDFAVQLQEMTGLEPEFFGILLKAVGISLISEIAILVCNDSGNSALGKGIQILASGVVLWLSLPLMRSLLSLVESIAGGI